MKDLFLKTRKAFSQNFKPQKYLEEIKKSQNTEKMQLLAKRERYEIWNQNDMAKLYLIEIWSLRKRFQKYGLGKESGGVPVAGGDGSMKILKTQ